jgi:hypothetical protein
MYIGLGTWSLRGGLLRGGDGGRFLTYNRVIVFTHSFGYCLSLVESWAQLTRDLFSITLHQTEGDCRLHSMNINQQA